MLAVLALAILAYWGIYRLYPFDHQDIVRYYAHMSGLDPRFVAAVIRTESGWSPGAVSRVGAVGLMQVMPETARWAAGRANLPGYSDEKLFQPDVNILLGTWYLSYLRAQFGGNLTIALAAYNAGDVEVRRWLESKRWSGQASDLMQVPFPETREFVARVWNSYRWYERLYRR